MNFFKKIINRLNDGYSSGNNAQDFIFELDNFNTDWCLDYLIDNYGQLKIVGLENRYEICQAYKNLVQTAILILINKAFDQLPTYKKTNTIVMIYNSLMSGLPNESAQIADFIAMHYQNILKQPDCDIATALKLYDCLYGLYFSSAVNLSDMKSFDDKCVKPCETFLRRNATRTYEYELNMTNRDITNICYFIHCAHFDKGNAVSPIIASLAKLHSERPDYHVYIYCVQWVVAEFKKYFDYSKITIREFKQEGKYNQLETIFNQIRNDNIDVVVTDLNSAISTYLYTMRAAPVQMWIDMGYPYWSIRNLDWVLLPTKDYQPNFGIPEDKYSYLTLSQESSMLIQESNGYQTAQLRSNFPERAFIYATFNRLIKLTPEYLEVVRKILSANDSAHMLIVGKGDPRLVYEFIDKEKLNERITFINDNVDINVYGHIIDVFLDTFPFIAGLAAREAGMLGKPILSMRTSDWQKGLREERSPNLLADSVDQYVDIAFRLSSDSNFYQIESQLTKDIINQTTDVSRMVDEIDKVVKLIKANNTIH